MACAAITLALLSVAGPSIEVPAFSDQTDAAGLTFTHQTNVANQDERHAMTGGLAAGDFDRDGFLDLFVQGGAGQNARLFMNNGDGTFTDRAAEWGIDLTDVEGSSVTVGDLDGNGYLDVYAGALDGRNYLFMNDGAGSFVETGLASGSVLIGGLWFDTFGATLGDIDHDGDLDLVTAQWYPIAVEGDRLFVNDGSAAFTEWTAAAGVYTPTEIWGFSPALVDLDGDHYADLPVAADFGTSQYHASDGDGTFTRLVGNGTCTDENGMGSALGDYDNDGDLDWFVTSIYDDDGKAEGNWGITGNRLYRNDGNHQFTDVTEVAGVRNGYWGWGTGFGDLNNDGLLDLAMTNGFIMPSGSLDPTFETDPSRLWLNTGDFFIGPTFVEVSSEAGIVHTASGKGLVTFDADNDGDLDIVIASNQDELKFFRNEYNPGPDRWLEMDFVSPPGHAPDGVGATVAVTAGGKTFHRAVFGSPTFMGQDPLRVHVGFPAAPTIESIVVQWANGMVTALVHVHSGQIVVIRFADLDGDGIVSTPDLLSLLSGWGHCPDPPAPCPGDLDNSGAVGSADLLLMLSNWG